MLRVLLAGACFIIIVAGLKAAAPIVNLVLLGLLVAQSLSNLPMWLMKRGLKPGVSVLVSILFVLAGGLVLVALFSISTARLADQPAPVLLPLGAEPGAHWSWTETNA